MISEPIPFTDEKDKLQIWHIQDWSVHAEAVLIHPPRPKRQRQQMMVLGGSEFQKIAESSCPPNALKIRKYLIRKGMIDEIDGKSVLNSHVVFSHPTTAANVILGLSKNGWDWWKRTFQKAFNLELSLANATQDNWQKGLRRLSLCYYSVPPDALDTTKNFEWEIAQID